MIKKYKNFSENFAAFILLAILYLFFLGIITVVVVCPVMERRFGVHTKLTDFIIKDSRDLIDMFGGSEDSQRWLVPIDWEELYPFAELGKKEKKSANKKLPLSKYSMRINAIESSIEHYSTGCLMRYNRLVEDSMGYELMTGWNYMAYGEYNGVVKSEDDYWISWSAKGDKTDAKEALTNFSKDCRRQGIDFLYIQAPRKCSESEDADASGTLDYGNQDTTGMLNELRDDGVTVYDLREEITYEGLSQHALFYRSDHHWMTTTGLWAARNTLEFCNENFDFHADTSMLSDDRFTKETYPEWFLGSQGKKVTLARCKPEDFILLYPRFDTSIHFYAPGAGVDANGDISIVYDMELLSQKDYYGRNPYAACSYGDQPLIRIENPGASDGKRILLIHDSFADCYLPWLSICEAQVDAIDLRAFTGSLKSYMEESKPDIVMVMYSGIPNTIEWETHQSELDFR